MSVCLLSASLHLSVSPGEDLLAGGQVYCLRPLQLHSVWEQLHLSTPSGPELHTHLAHILDFTCRLRYLKVLTWIYIYIKR